MFYCDGGGRVLKVNRTALRMFGYRKDEVLKRTIEEILVPEADWDLSVGHWKTLFGEGRPIQLEAERRKKDGSPLSVRLIGVPVFVKGEAKGAYLLYEDLTAEREAKNATERLNRLLEAQVQEERRVWEETIKVLARATELRDPYTAGHQRSVASLARAIAEEIGMEPEACHRVEMAAMIHDVGKIEVPSEILVKPGALSPLERGLIQLHCEAGREILKDVVLSWPLAEIVYQHHERLDGSGYPQGLKGGEILLEARIIAVADTVEAMASHRPYRPARGIGEALAEIERGRGLQYDPVVSDACLRLFREGKFSLFRKKKTAEETPGSAEGVAKGKEI